MRFEREREAKRLIFDMYKGAFNRNPDLFRKHKEYSLSPLSNLMAELFDDFNAQDALNCLQILGNNALENYSEDLIVKMYDRFSSSQQIAFLYADDQKFFLEFAKAWPKFMKNNAIITKLTQIDSTQIKVEDQSETLSILTQKNVLYPELIQEHFVQFMRLADKGSVAKYLRQFLKSSAYFGYTDGIDMEQVTQVFRRIYKQPSAAGMSQLLDFLITLAVSNAYFKDFDPKSRLFVEAALDLVEENFTGTSHRTALRKNDQNQDEEFKLFYFNQMPSERKTYNKILQKNLPKWEQNYIQGGRQDYFKHDDESSEEEAIEDAEEFEEAAILVEQAKIVDEDLEDVEEVEDITEEEDDEGDI